MAFLAELPADVRAQAAWMLLLVAALLGGFVLVVLIIGIARARKRRSFHTRRKSPTPQIDPWVEAGRRLDVTQSDIDDPEDSDD